MPNYFDYQLAVMRYMSISSFRIATGGKSSNLEKVALDIVEKYEREFRKDRFFIEE